MLSAAARLQRILPGAILVGGSAAAVYAEHRLSTDADHSRDYLDFGALADHLGEESMVAALRPFDQLYPQPNKESALQQLQIQLANPLPYDLEGLDLSEYKNLPPRWHDWSAVKAACVHHAILIFDQITGLGD